MPPGGTLFSSLMMSHHLHSSAFPLSGAVGHSDSSVLSLSAPPAITISDADQDAMHTDGAHSSARQSGRASTRHATVAPLSATSSSPAAGSSSAPTSSSSSSTASGDGEHAGRRTPEAKRMDVMTAHRTIQELFDQLTPEERRDAVARVVKQCALSRDAVLEVRSFILFLSSSSRVN